MMEDIQTTASWVDEDGERQFDRASYASEDYSWLATTLKEFPDAIRGASWRERCHRATAHIKERFRKGEITKAEAVKLLREAVRRQRMDSEAFSRQLTKERKKLHDPKEVLLYLAGAMRERGRSGQPVTLLPGDLEVLADKIGQLDPAKRSTGRKSKDLRKLAISWAVLWRKSRREGVKARGLAEVIDHKLADTVDLTTEAERPGQEIGLRAVQEAKRRFRKYIARIKADHESDILPNPGEGLKT